jgi:hypothetical protein
MKYLLFCLLFLNITLNAQNQEKSFYKLLKGKLGEEYITMNLIVTDTIIRGNYYRGNSDLINFDYSSKIDKNGIFIIPDQITYDEEYNPVPEGVFTGTLIGDKAEGFYKNQKTGQEVPFLLAEDYSNGSLSFTYEYYSKTLDSSASIEIAYPYLIQKSSAAGKINQKIREMVIGEDDIKKDNKTILNEYIEYYKETLKDIAIEGIEDYHPVFYKSTISEVGLNEKGILSLSCFHSNYEGGAHPNSAILLKSYFLESGEEIKLDDIFEGNYLSVFNKIGERELRNYYQINEDIPLEEAGFWFENGFKLNDNFYLLKNGLKFIFNQYEIAAYALGAPEIFIKYDEIKSYIRSGGVFP